MAEPPLLAGAVKVTRAEESPNVAVPTMGAPGVVAGVTGEAGVEASDDPLALVATTVKV